MARLSVSRLADTLADRILWTDDRRSDPHPRTYTASIRFLGQRHLPSQLAQRLRDHDPNATPALRWLNEQVGSAEGTTTDQIVREEVQEQSAMNVTVRNVITSMRLVSMINWAEFFESVSPVDAILRGGSDFAAMDFPTRDLYRRAIEEIARQSGRDEDRGCRTRVTAAKRARSRPRKRSAVRGESDPGYYLIAKGRRAFEKELGCRVPFKTRFFRLNSDLGRDELCRHDRGRHRDYVALALIAVAYVGPAAGHVLRCWHSSVWSRRPTSPSHSSTARSPVRSAACCCPD